MIFLYFIISMLIVSNVLPIKEVAEDNLGKSLISLLSAVRRSVNWSTSSVAFCHGCILCLRNSLFDISPDKDVLLRYLPAAHLDGLRRTKWCCPCVRKNVLCVSKPYLRDQTLLVSLFQRLSPLSHRVTHGADCIGLENPQSIRCRNPFLQMLGRLRDWLISKAHLLDNEALSLPH